MVLKNKTIFLNRESKKMEIPIYLESSIRPLIHRDIRLQEYMKDPTHDLKYRISPISLESSIQLLMKIGDYDKQGKLIHKFFRYIPYSRSIFEDEDFLQNSVKLKDTKQLTDLYSAGSWTDNPFTSFINYYQIIEYFFNEIPDNRLFKMVQKQITSPLFSYNRKNDIIQLAKQIYDVRKNDMNELNSLEIVLDYFLDIKMRRL